MTAQIPERLKFDGQSLSMCTEPLGAYFSAAGKHPKFADTCTALWRGYVGSWEIVEGCLYLVGIDAIDEDGNRIVLEDMFPGHPDRVFAHWYSGDLRCPRGGQIEYVHMGYGSVFEEDLFLHIKAGVLVGRHVKNNGKAEEGAPHDYGPAAFVTFPLRSRQGEDE